MMIKWAVFGAVWIAIAALLTGCHKPTSTSQDTLSIMLTEPPRSMDPADHTATLTATVLAPMYEGLVRMTRTGPQPVLATSWTPAADQRSWTFRLRSGVRFHDGSLLDAASVAATFNRLIDPQSALAASGKFTSVIASVDRLDSQTVRLNLHKPYADLLTLLSSNQASIVAPRAVSAGSLSRSADGTGPFRFSAWAPGISVIEARFDGYWGDRPRLAHLQWLSSSEPAVLYMALRSGTADVAFPLAPIFAIKTRDDAALRLIHQPAANVFWIAINTRLAPFDDVRVRQALNFATDRAALVSALLWGFGQPATAAVAASTPYASPDPQRLRYDVGRAREMIRTAGLSDRLHVAVAVQESDEPLAEALQAMWLKAGVDLQIRRLEGGVYAAAAFAPPEVKRADGLGGVLASWSSGVVPELQLRPLFASKSAAPAGANLGFYDNPKIDALLDAAEACRQSADRGRLYGEAQGLILQEAPAVMLYTRDDIAGLRRITHGLSIEPDGVLTVARAYKS